MLSRARRALRSRGAAAAVLIGALSWHSPSALLASTPKPTVFDTTLEELGQRTPELSTSDFKAFLARRNGVVLDARPAHEYALAHIPGSISIDEKGLLRVAQAVPERSTEIVVYSNGPFCDWAKRRADQLVNLGYTRVRRYQLGLSIWRALGNTAETNLDGFRRAFYGNNAVIVDARSRTEHLAGTIPAAQTILPGEAAKAREDHRLQFYDHSTRVVVFGNSAREARTVAEEIARVAFPNSSYFGGTYEDLKRARFFTERKPSPIPADGPKR